MPVTPEQLANGSEHGEQAAVFCWAAMNFKQYPLLRWMYANPNGGGRSMSQGLALKAEGVKSGVADIFLPVVRSYADWACPGLYIEMKKLKGVPSDVTREQVEFAKFVTIQGYRWHVCFGWQQAIELLVSYLDNVPYVLSKHQQMVHKRVMDYMQVKSDWQL